MPLETSTLSKEIKHKSRWLRASLLLLVLSGLAILLLWGAGPFAPRFTTPEMEEARWRLPDWLWITSFVIAIVAIPAAVICGLIATVKARPRYLRLRTVVALLFVLLVLVVLMRVP